MATRKLLNAYRIILLVLLAGTVAALSAAAFYNRPTMDDLWQPYDAMNVIRNGGSFWNALKVAFQGMLQSYQNWNGVFFSMFLSYFPPMIFGEKLAFIHPIVIMLLLIGGCFCLAGCLKKLDPGLPSSAVQSAAMLGSLMMLWLIYSVSEGIMWYSGSINYTFLFALSLYLFSGLFSLSLSAQGISGAKRALFTVLLCVGFFLVGGGNFSTSTVSLVAYGMFLVYLVIGKKPAYLALPFAFLLAGYGLAVLAPGNAVRQAATGVPTPIFLALLDSYLWAFRFIFWDARVLPFLLLFVPLAVVLSRNLHVEYWHVFLLLLISMTLLAASAFSSVYATGGKGPNRQMNIHLFLFYLLALVNMIWQAAAVRKMISAHYERKSADTLADGKAGRKTHDQKWLHVYMATAFLALLLLSSPNFSIRPFQFGCFLPPVKALSYLVDGELKAFAGEYDQMVEQIRAQPDQKLVFDSQPWVWLFGGTGLSDDPADWQNAAFAKYYGNGQTTVACLEEE